MTSGDSPGVDSAQSVSGAGRGRAGRRRWIRRRSASTAELARSANVSAANSVTAANTTTWPAARNTKRRLTPPSLGMPGDARSGHAPGLPPDAPTVASPGRNCQNQAAVITTTTTRAATSLLAASTAGSRQLPASATATSAAAAPGNTHRCRRASAPTPAETASTSISPPPIRTALSWVPNERIAHSRTATGV